MVAPITTSMVLLPYNESMVNLLHMYGWPFLLVWFLMKNKSSCLRMKMSLIKIERSWTMSINKFITDMLNIDENCTHNQFLLHHESLMFCWKTHHNDNLWCWYLLQIILLVEMGFIVSPLSPPFLCFFVCFKAIFVTFLRYYLYLL